MAQVKKKLDEINNASAKQRALPPDKSQLEPPEIRQLRLQVHQYEDLIGQASRDQKKLQQEISVYQGRVAAESERSKNSTRNLPVIMTTRRRTTRT